MEGSLNEVLQRIEAGLWSELISNVFSKMRCRKEEATPSSDIKGPLMNMDMLIRHLFACSILVDCRAHLIESFPNMPQSP